MFGDIGEGIIGDDGKAYISIDPVFSETVDLSSYQVFLQKYGSGECFVLERHGAFFVVAGTPGLSFGWELKAKQADLSQRRLDAYQNIFQFDETDYGANALSHIEEILSERGVAA